MLGSLLYLTLLPFSLGSPNTCSKERPMHLVYDGSCQGKTFRSYRDQGHSIKTGYRWIQCFAAFTCSSGLQDAGDPRHFRLDGFNLAHGGVRILASTDCCLRL